MAPPGGLAEAEDAGRAAAAEDDVEASLVRAAAGTEASPAALARRRRCALVGLATAAAGACAALALCGTQRSRPLLARAPAEGQALTRLWSPGEESGPCPENDVCMGHGCGITRRPMFFTVGQAFHCLDMNGDGELTWEEIKYGGRGANFTGKFVAPNVLKAQVSWKGGLSFYWFQDGMRLYRDRMFEHEPVVAEKLVHWAEQIFRMRDPEGEGDEAAKLPYEAPAPEMVELGAGPEEEEQEEEEEAVAPGKVKRVFTFGAPAISKVPLWNAAREDGCFPGARIYNSGSEYIQEYLLRMHVSDPLSWIFTELGFAHYRTNAVSLREDTAAKQGWSKCQGSEPAWLGPHSDMFFWWEGTRPLAYEDNLKALSELINPLKDAALDWEVKTGEAAEQEPPAPSRSAAPTAGIFAGDRVKFKDNATFVKQAFESLNLPFSKEVQEHMGKSLRVFRLRKPGVLAVRPLGAPQGGEWDVPKSTLELERSVATVPALVAEEVPVVKAEQGASGVKKKRREQLARIREAAHLAMLSYATVSEVTADLEAREWEFVGRGSGGNVSVTLMQHAGSLDCVLSFGIRHIVEGSTNANFDPVHALHEVPPDEGRLQRSLVHLLQMLASTHPMYDQHKKEKGTGERIFSKPYYGNIYEEEVEKEEAHAMLAMTSNAWKDESFCGFEKVQYHMTRFIQSLINSENYRPAIEKTLPFCSSVTAVGHGLGGALAALWAACANRGLKPGEEGYEDYEKVSWQTKAAERLQGVASGRLTGVVIKDASTNLGVGIAGSLSAAAAGTGGLRLTPFADAGWQQRWQLTPEGYLQNPHSGKCLSVASYDAFEAIGVKLQLQTCRPGVAGLDQRWTLSKSHVLVHAYSGRCLSGEMKLARCPLTDQRWHMNANGFIVNRITGKCLDVTGSPGTSDGDKINVWPCEHGQKMTDQQWEITASGRIRNLLSGKCLEVDNVHSKQHGAYWHSNLVLWECAADNTTFEHTQSWVFADNGFIINSLNGKCVDVYGGNIDKPPGTDMILAPCQRTFPQTSSMWELTKDQYIMNIGREEAYRNKCVTIETDAEDADLSLEECETRMRHEWELHENGHIETKLGIHQCIGAQGDQLGLTTCAENDPSQSWNLTEEGFLVNRLTQKCIDIAPYDLTLRQDDCHMTDQRWMTRPSGAIRSRLSGLCIDVVGIPPEDMKAGTPVSTWECEHDREAFLKGVVTTDQIWEITREKTIRNRLSNMCIDIEGEGKAKMYNGARVVMQPCDRNSTAQYWEMDLEGFFRNRLSGKCIDVKGPAGHTKGQFLVMYTCEDDKDFSNQLWSFAKAGSGRQFSPKLPYGLPPTKYVWTGAS